MKAKILAIFAGTLFTCLSASAFSQEINEDVILAQIEFARAVGRDQTRAIFQESMKLNEEEAQLFWPVFDNYMEDMLVINDRLLRLITGYAEYYNDGAESEGVARSLIIEYFDIESDRISVKHRHLENFTRVLPDQKVYLFFQLENRLQNLVNLGLASEIPLINE